MARSSGWMRIKFLFHSVFWTPRKKCVEDSGEVQRRQENSAKRRPESERLPNFSSLRTWAALSATFVARSRICFLHALRSGI